jgi:hypothetical protein
VLPTGEEEDDGPSIVQVCGYKVPTGKQCHVFISHAGEEKRGFVDFLLADFNKRYPALTVFVDDYSLKVGGDAMSAMSAALQDAFVGTLSTAANVPQSMATQWSAANIVRPYEVQHQNLSMYRKNTNS